jgi:small subunit ribosomal protein S20
LANKKSAEKRARQALKAYDRNRWYRSRARTFVKRTRALIAAGDLPAAEDGMRRACQALDKAAQKGVIHRNNAARRKSRLVKAYKQAQGSAAEVQV